MRQHIQSWVTYCGALALLAIRLAAPASAADFKWDLPPWITPPQVPADNPMGAAKVELGRRLFFDIRLSGPGYVACASCHKPNHGFADQRPFSFGATGKTTRLNSPSLTNVGYLGALTLAHPGIQSLEAQARRPLFSVAPIEMGVRGYEAQVVDLVARNSLYAALFRDAFPGRDGAVTFDTIIKALAAFQRTLISANSPYDRYRYRGETSALSPAARRGEKLFYGSRLKCSRCHNGQHLSDAIPNAHYHNTGLYNVDGSGGLPERHRGLIENTGKPGDMGKFRTPSLRNVAATAPYMHDGSLKTLQAVLDHYAAGGEAARKGRRSPLTSPLVAGFEISGKERREVIAFLENLTDESFLNNPRLRSPFH